MNPHHQSALSEADIPDTLMQLLLPSDEWYYTNHSTKYARYVKYHAARILVYMGLFYRLGGRVDLFDTKSKCVVLYFSIIQLIQGPSLIQWKRVGLLSDESVNLCWEHVSPIYSLFQSPAQFNTLRPRQYGRHFADDIFKCIFLNENVWILTRISLKFILKGPINNIPALVQIMAWRWPGDKPLSEPMMVRLPKA